MSLGCKHWLLAGFVMVALALRTQAEPPQQTQAHSDLYGDPLPEGALARLGTLRLRHAAALSSVTFLPGGKALATVGLDQTVRLWDAETGGELRRFTDRSAKPVDDSCFTLGGSLGPNWRTFSASFSADGKLLATGFPDGPIQLWDVGTGKPLRRINRPKLELPAGVPALPEWPASSPLAFSTDHKLVASTGGDGIIHLWNSETGTEVRRFGKRRDAAAIPYSAYFRAFEFSPDDKTFVTSLYEMGPQESTGAFRFWDVASGKQRFEVKGDNCGPMIGMAAYSPNGSMVALSGFANLGILLVDANTGKELRKVKDSSLLDRFIFSPDGKRLIVDGCLEVSVFDVATGRQLEPLISFQGEARGAGITGLAFSPDGAILARGVQNTVRFLDTTSRKYVHVEAGHEARVTSVQFSRDGRSLLSVSEDSDICRWNTASGKLLEERPVPLRVPSSNFTLSPDGQTVVDRGYVDGVAVWDTDTGRERFSIRSKKIAFSARAYSPDSKMLAMEEILAPVIHLFDTITGKELRGFDAPSQSSDKLPGPSPFPMACSLGLAFSADGRRIAGPSLGNLVGVWDVSTGKLLGQIPLTEAYPPQVLALSPDGRSLALASAANTLSLYELWTGQRRRYFGTKPTEGGSWLEELATHGPAAREQFLRDQGEPLRSCFAESPRNLLFGADGRILCHGRADQVIALWDVLAGQTLGSLKGHQGPVGALALAPDGKRLASGSSDTNVLIWDMDALSRSLPQLKVELTPRDFENGWAALASADAGKAYEALCLFASTPRSVVPYLKKKLRPAAALDAKRVEQWIADLDSDRFPVRQTASRELEQLEDRVLPALRKALGRKPSLETRQRIEQILAKLTAKIIRNGERLRSLRAIEALEKIGTPEAGEILQSIAAGSPGILETEEARVALERLKQRGNGQ